MAASAAMPSPLFFVSSTHRSLYRSSAATWSWMSKRPCGREGSMRAAELGFWKIRRATPLTLH